MRSFLTIRRELLLLVPLTTSGLAFAWFAFQPDPPNPLIQVAADAKFINESERKAIASYQAIANEVRAGTLNDLDAAKRVETDVLPVWQAARRRVIAARSGPAAEYFPKELEDFFRLREESWQALVVGVRDQNEAAIKRQQETWREADAVLLKLRAAPTAKNR